MIRNYRISTVFVERSHLLAGDGGKFGALQRAFYESVYDLPKAVGATSDRAWLSPGDLPFWQMWCGRAKLPDGYGAWRAVVPLRLKPDFHATDSRRRVDVKLECFAHAHTRAAIVSCLSRGAKLNDDDWSATVRALRSSPTFAIRNADGTRTLAGLTLTELGRSTVARLQGPPPTVAHERMPPFTLVTPCADDDSAGKWTAEREDELAAAVISADGSAADPFLYEGNRRNPVDIHHAGTAAVLISSAWMTAAGHPVRLAHYHRNLALGIMQVQALLQLVAELDAAPDEDCAFRQSSYEFARSAMSMLRRVVDGRGTYRSKLLAALAARHTSAAKRVSKMLGSIELVETKLQGLSPHQGATRASGDGD